MEERKQSVRRGSFSLPENFKLKTSNFHNTLPLEGGNPGRAPVIGFFPGSALFLGHAGLVRFCRRQSLT